MARATRICKICGKVYPYCLSMRTVEGVYRWQDVACCPEHGSEYLMAVRISRSEIEDVPIAEPKRATRKTRRAAEVGGGAPLDEVEASDD